MCGIAGFFSLEPVAPQTPERMLDVLRRRGPDAQHSVLWNSRFERTQGAASNALLHARLSIIDPRPEADQPMANEAKDIWICYNGEVYDWAGPAAELKALGYSFRNRSDTEFILRAYEAWGIDCIARLRGMFAFAILDLRRRTAWLVRDRMGLKPLIYASFDGRLAFGSTVRSVLPFLPGSKREFSAEGIDAYLAHRYIPAPRTVFSSINRIENGHYIRFDLDSRRLEKVRYWYPRPQAGNWLETLDQAVEMRTVADRPLGVFLSGGIDSSVIASRLAALGHRDLHSFTAAFPGSPMDESAQATEVADRLELRNLAIPINADIARDFSRIVADLDEPFADPSSVPSWYLSQETTNHVKVVLGGEGGDELLAGYKRMRQHLCSRWRRGLRLPGLPISSSMARSGGAKWIAEMRMSWKDAYSLRFSGFGPQQRRFLSGGKPLQRELYWRAADTEEEGALNEILQIDWANYLPEYILRKGDLCTMAHGLELRAPLLDHVFFQTLLSLPEETRFTSPPKRMLAPALVAIADLDLFARKKRGFNPPLQPWLRGALSARFEGLGERLNAMTNGMLPGTAIAEMVQAYKSGDETLAEGILQLLILDESLAQLSSLRADASH
ncbi:MAG: asparagine synthase (glutamine-hydrolyzing) [Betaproteobacteria bacterium]|nr:asparagine synthase (glutamine-hydrolyzing) [Betaproteobacteria bacterium]